MPIKLVDRMREYLRLLCQGYTAKEICHIMGVSPSTLREWRARNPDAGWFEVARHALGAARGLEPTRLHRRIEQLRDQLELGSVMAKPIHKLSRGFRQRVGLAQALVHEPDVLILDEPTNGLDPNQIREVRRVIRTFGRDKAVLLSTHILQEVEAVCDRVVFINEGRIVFTGTVDELRAKADTLDLAFAAFTQPVGARS